MFEYLWLLLVTYAYLHAIQHKIILAQSYQYCGSLGFWLKDNLALDVESSSSLEPGCDVNIILEHSSQICLTAISTFGLELVMASSEERKRKRDGDSESQAPPTFEMLCTSL